MIFLICVIAMILLLSGTFSIDTRYPPPPQATDGFLKTIGYRNSSSRNGVTNYDLAT
ncbi:MAG: hypothetical protein OXI63_17630 [Candidatus Poribacteria bacterium]|nr:hypothetical protein [Candidatus Poribacteria bacterium]